MEDQLTILKKRSQLNAIMTLFAGLLVLGSLAFSFYTLNKMQIKRDALALEISDKKSQLEKLGGLLVEASQEGQLQDNKSLQEATEYYLDIKSEEGELTVTEELALLQSVGDEKLSPAQIERKKALEGKVETVATISDDSKILTCAKVMNNQPSAQKTEFSIGQDVYFWSQVNSPGNEEIRAEWKNVDTDKMVKTKSFTIGRNTGKGFTIWDYKAIREAGNYSITMYNSSDLLIGKTEFEVN